MDDKRANIDLVFRNGLKGYEVLPPQEVWNNIKPLVRRKQRPLIILRTAAAVTILLSLSFMIYRWSLQINERLENTVLAGTEEPVTPVDITRDPIIVQEQPASDKLPIPIREFKPAAEDISGSLSENNTGHVSIAEFHPYSDRIALNDRGLQRSGLRELFRPEKKEINIENVASLYLPEIPVKEKSDRWTIGAIVSPAYYTNFYSGNDELTSTLISNEKPLFSYSGGLAFSYKINKRVSVQSGLYYSSFGQELSGITAFGGFQPYDNTKGDRNFEILTASGRVYTDNADVFLIDRRIDNRVITRYTVDYFDPAKANLQYIDKNLRQNFSFLELPVIVRYKLIDKTIDFNLVGGLSSNILVNNSVYASSDGGRYQVGKTDGMNFLTFSSSLGMGMEYNFTGNLSLNLEPTLRYFLNPFNQFSGLKSHPYYFGIFSGLSYRF